MTIPKLVLVFVFIQVITLNQILAQKWKSEVYTYTKDFLDSYNFQESGEKEILLIGTFHFRNKQYTVKNVERQIIDFNPDAIFIEEVPAFDEVQYKEQYKNELYDNPRWGNRLYSNTIDSAVIFSGVTREESKLLIENQYLLLSKFPEDIEARVKFINLLFINGDDPNAYLQFHYLKELVSKNSEISFDSLKKQISPASLKYDFTMGETRHLTVPVAYQLHHQKLYSMDFQQRRKETDSILSIVRKTMVAKIILRFWEIPYMIKMMRLDQKLPKDNQDAERYFKILNEPKSIKNMAKVQEVYPYSNRNKASKVWIDIYRKRNMEMVSIIEKRLRKEDFKSAAIIVGAGHVSHFLYEIQKQMPDFRVRLLNVDQL